MSRVKSLLLIAFLAICGQVEAAIVHTGGDEAALGLGSSYSNVGMLRSYDTLGGETDYHSGTLIAPNAVWFSRHGPLKDSLDLSSLYATTEITFNNNGLFGFADPSQIYRLSHLYLHPFSDQAVGILDVTLSITPAERFRGTLLDGDEIVMAGYGARVFAGQDPSEAVFTGDRRAGLDVISHVTSEEFITQLNRSSQSSYRVGEIGGWHRDSGGGAFLLSGLLTGQISNGSTIPRIGSVTGFTRLDNEFIDGRLALHPVKAVPEPSSVILFSLALPSLAFVRSRRKLVTA